MKEFKLSLYEGKVYLCTLTILAFSAYTAYFKAKDKYPTATNYQITEI